MSCRLQEGGSQGTFCSVHCTGSACLSLISHKAGWKCGLRQAFAGQQETASSVQWGNVVIHNSEMKGAVSHSPACLQPHVWQIRGGKGENSCAVLELGLRKPDVQQRSGA